MSKTLRNYRAVFLIFCVLTASCESVSVKNAAPNSNAPANNTNVSANDAGHAASNRAENSSGGDNSNASANAAPEPKDFEGTAGVTEKKYEIKAAAVLKEVRAAAHEGFDRVAFEFEGAEMPSYHIEYVDKPVRACGSGDVVPLAGDGWLEIRFTPAAAHTEAGEATVKNRVQKPNLKIIREMKATCDFEAEVEWVLGTSAPNKYRVLELKNPTRLVVDIKH